MYDTIQVHRVLEAHIKFKSKKHIKEGKMSFKIDLGLKKDQPAHVENIDMGVAIEEMYRAEYALKECEVEEAILTSAVENLQRGIEFSKAVVEKTQDESLAIVVGKEALASSLRIIGQEEVLEGVTAGTESYEAGIEANENILTTMIKTLKKYVKKAWEFLVNLVSKVVDYIKGLFGQKGYAAAKLQKILDKAKEEGKTKLSKDKFDEEVAVKLASNNIGVIEAAGGALSVKSLQGQIKEISDFFDKRGSILASLKLLDKSVFDAASKLGKDSNMEQIRKAISLMPVVSVVSKEAEGIFPDGLNKNIIEAVKKELGGDVKRIHAKGYIASGKVILVPVKYYDGSEDVVQKLYDNNLKGADALKAFKEAVAGVKSKIVVIKPETKDAEKYADKIKPLNFNEATSLVKEVDSITSTMEKYTKDFKADVENAKNRILNSIDAVEKEMAKQSEEDEIKSLVAKTLKDYLKIVDSVARAEVKATVEATKNIVKPSWGDYVIESAKLYEGEGTKK